MHAEFRNTNERRSQREGAGLVAINRRIVSRPFGKPGPGALQHRIAPHKRQYVGCQQEQQLLQVVTRNAVSRFMTKSSFFLLLAQCIHHVLRNQNARVEDPRHRHNRRRLVHYEYFRGVAVGSGCAHERAVSTHVTPCAYHRNQSAQQRRRPDRRSERSRQEANHSNTLTRNVRLKPNIAGDTEPQHQKQCYGCRRNSQPEQKASRGPRPHRLGNSHRRAGDAAHHQPAQCVHHEERGETQAKQPHVVWKSHLLSFPDNSSRFCWIFFSSSSSSIASWVPTASTKHDSNNSREASGPARNPAIISPARRRSQSSRVTLGEYTNARSFSSRSSRPFL